jgi:DNA polymerase-3 subunit delta'
VDIIGHQKIIKLLDRSIAKSSVSQAYLFSGPAHVGKFSVALEFAKKLNGKDLASDLDVIILAPEMEEVKGVFKERGIKIEHIRDMQRKLNMTSYGDAYRIAIIDEAQKLSQSVQNSLLKILEEPPRKCVIILIAQDENKILPTVRSRCRTLKFGLVSDKEMENIPSDQDRSKILFWSLGRPGLAKKFSGDRRELEKKEALSRELDALLDSSVSEKFDLAESMSKDSLELAEKMDSWLVIFRDILLAKERRNAVSQHKSLEIISELENAIKILAGTNANPRLVLENLLLKFV